MKSCMFIEFQKEKKKGGGRLMSLQVISCSLKTN